MDDFTALPAEVQRLISKRGPLDAGEANLLSTYLTQNGTTLDPALATMIGAKIGSAPTDWRSEISGLTPNAAPSVAEQVGASLGMGVPSSDPAVDWMQQQPGSTPPSWGAPTLDFLNREDAPGPALRPPSPTDIMMAGLTPPAAAPMPTPPPAQAPGAAPMPAPPTTAPLTSGPGNDITAEATPGPSGVRVSPDTGAVTPPQDFIAGVDFISPVAFQPPRPGPFSTSDTETIGSGANPLPDQGGQHDRRKERGGRANWKVERDRLGGESAFSDVGEGFMIDYASSPELAARALARRLGGGAQTAALILPQVQAGMQLIQSGGYGGRRGQLGPGASSSSAQLDLLEDYIRQGSGTGTAINPRATTRGALRQAVRTPVEVLQAGAENPDDPMSGLFQQVQVTNDALMAGSGQWGPGAAGDLEAKLEAASLAWMEAVATGATTMSYPEYLRKQGARRWVR